MASEFIEKLLKIDEIDEALTSAFDFYKEFSEIEDVKEKFTLSLNDKHNRWRLGAFYRKTGDIEINDVKKQIEDSTLTATFIHELAHLIDNRRREGRFSFSSCKKHTSENKVMQLFLENMEPVPVKSTNYRGRKCEIFARAIEEYYCIREDNMREFIMTSDLYVKKDKYIEKIYKSVEQYVENGGVL